MGDYHLINEIKYTRDLINKEAKDYCEGADLWRALKLEREDVLWTTGPFLGHVSLIIALPCLLLWPYDSKFLIVGVVFIFIWLMLCPRKYWKHARLSHDIDQCEKYLSETGIILGQLRDDVIDQIVDVLKGAREPRMVTSTPIPNDVLPFEESTLARGVHVYEELTPSMRKNLNDLLSEDNSIL